MKTVGLFNTPLQILIERSVKTLFIIILHEIESNFQRTVTDIRQGTLTDLFETVSSEVIDLMLFLIRFKVNFRS